MTRSARTPYGWGFCYGLQRNKKVRKKTVDLGRKGDLGDEKMATGER
jgi:hypothetical protein